MWSKKGSPSSNCAWVAEKPDTRCTAKDDGAVYALEQCQVACGGCDSPCVDDPTWHKNGDETKDCAWVSRLANRFTVVGSEGDVAWTKCRAAARSCDFVDPLRANCDDSTLWHKKDSPASDCKWVADKPETRCAAKDGNAVYAAERCLSACGGCGQSCEDSPTWHKNGDPAKDCAWVARLANRLTVVGEDGTLAWTQCRNAARSCYGFPQA
ncbi:hypothetical protein M885DRAFT_114290 [Pelagophyceae sp. CCMP2097]|nr:hypothetical protein M885DRAFT_114290 [Pelagophyceae sp. CCMP2097]